MSTKDNGGPAFPTDPNTQIGVSAHHGMTLRDWFAGQALAGLTGNQEQIDAFVSRRDGAAGVPALVSRLSYMYADAMLEARK